MGWLDQAKKAAEQAKEKIADVDTGSIRQRAKEISSDTVSGLSEKSSQVLCSAKDTLSNVDTTQVLTDAKTSAVGLSEKGQAIATESLLKSKDAIANIDWEQVTDIKHQSANIAEYLQSGTEKLNQMARSTLEIDKDTMQMVNDLQGRLPVPAETIDDIFTQCRDVAIQRATAAFFLAGAAEAIDRNSSEKYENLHESYKEYGDRVGGHNIRSHENFSQMQDQRANARSSFGTLEDGYSKEDILNAYDADIEHVIAAKEVYGSTLLRSGTKDQELIDAINNKDNLIFTNSSVNRSKGAVSLSDYLERSEPHPTKSGVRTISINGETHEINEADCQEALKKAQTGLNANKASAALEIGVTAAKTGATMAVQQVVGMMVVETIDILMDEMQRFSKEFKLFDEKGFVGNVQELNQRLSQKLNQRFEERQIWAKARELGVEAGVSGALSVIPQILISTLTRLPAFALGLIREGTLSCVRSARVLASKDPNKLQSTSIIMASTASAVVGLYVGRVISASISGVPLLNRFNNQITAILSGLLVTAVPLIAIYVFDQNKKRLAFSLGNKEASLL
ncbi:hypothetical protein [Photobacterium sanguinicancri]|uniref:hypothetical protein n=1 Tax=Photobacterium sanguinicancri TaxID=875932 RepID=UPI0026E3F687|nr:hypothetical protein [Photobacterium sanguinicancri]MDO6501148.1 hypothetical protein [Photobacterium sanguinicancri]